MNFKTRQWGRYLEGLWNGIWVQSILSFVLRYFIRCPFVFKVVNFYQAWLVLLILILFELWWLLYKLKVTIKLPNITHWLVTSLLSPYYINVMFINLSMGAIGVMDSSCISLLSLPHELRFDITIQKKIIMKAMNISIRTSYFISCRRNKTWNNPELLTL